MCFFGLALLFFIFFYGFLEIYGNCLHIERKKEKDSVDQVNAFDCLNCTGGLAMVLTCFAMFYAS